MEKPAPTKDLVQKYFQECYEKITFFVNATEDGTNICTVREIQQSLQRHSDHTKLPHGIIEDQAQDDDSFTQQSTASDSNGIGSDEYHQQYCEETLENNNALEAFIHPRDKMRKNARQHSKISFDGLTISFEQKHACAQAALFLYWPKSRFIFFFK